MIPNPMTLNPSMTPDPVIIIPNHMVTPNPMTLKPEYDPFVDDDS